MRRKTFILSALGLTVTSLVGACLAFREWGISDLDLSTAVTIFGSLLVIGSVFGLIFLLTRGLPFLETAKSSRVFEQIDGPDRWKFVAKQIYRFSLPILVGTAFSFYLSLYGEGVSVTTNVGKHLFIFVLALGIILVVSLVLFESKIRKLKSDAKQNPQIK